MRRVIVHVDRVVLRGIADGDRQGIAEGLQQELGTLFEDRAVVERLREGGRSGSVRVERMNGDRVTRPEAIGKKLADGISSSKRWLPAEETQ